MSTVEKDMINYEEYWWKDRKLSDILNANLHYELIGEASMLKYHSENEVKLYAGLNKANAEKLKNGTYNSLLIAYEYPEIAKTKEQAEVVVELAYNTRQIFDMLHPQACIEIENIIKNNKWTKKEVEDTTVITNILKQGRYTGVRVVRINKKCYPNTEMAFHRSHIIFCLNPKHVKFLNVEPIQ